MKTLPENFIPDKETNWIKICKYYKLSEEFIGKHYCNIKWFYVSVYQELSEELMEKYFDKINLDSISKFQKLSEEFIVKHFNKLDKYCLRYNENITRNVKRKLCIDYIKIKSKRLFFRKKFLYI